MKLFLPSARATNWLLIVGFCSLGYALYIRYLALEQSSVGLACAAGLDTWLCFSRRIIGALFRYNVFGITALVVAALNLFYNLGLASLAVGLLLLSLARRAPGSE